MSSAVFGTKEQVVDGESGLLFPPGDVRALAGHIERLVADPERRAALGRAAADRAWELASYWEMVNRYAVLIERVLTEAVEGVQDETARAALGAAVTGWWEAAA